MGSFIVTYSLTKKTTKYVRLFDILKSHSSWWHKIDYVWLIKSDSTAEEILTDLKPELHEEDILLVNSLGRDSAWYGVDESTSLNFKYIYRLNKYVFKQN